MFYIYYAALTKLFLIYLTHEEDHITMLTAPTAHLVLKMTNTALYAHVGRNTPTDL